MANMQDMFNFYDQIEEMNNMIEVVVMVNLGLNDEDEGEVQRAPKRYIRDGENPFGFYSEQEFKRRFRYSKDNIMYGILPRIKAALVRANNRGLPIPPVMQLLICVRFYAAASFQLVNGDLMNISQCAVSTIIHRTCRRFIGIEGTFFPQCKVVGPNMECLDVVLEWPESNYDSRIFQNSRIYMRYRKRQLTGTLVGDAGYPCLPFLLTTLTNPITDAQQR
nr:uncharacterized protein LOC124212257 [Neodiprion pinetum]